MRRKAARDGMVAEGEELQTNLLQVSQRGPASSSVLDEVFGTHSGRMDRFQSHPWQRLTLAAVIAVGIGLSAILAVHFSNAQIEERRHQLMVEATGFAGDLEQYLQNRELIA